MDCSTIFHNLFVLHIFFHFEVAVLVTYLSAIVLIVLFLMQKFGNSPPSWEHGHPVPLLLAYIVCASLPMVSFCFVVQYFASRVSLQMVLPFRSQPLQMVSFLYCLVLHLEQLTTCLISNTFHKTENTETCVVKNAEHTGSSSCVSNLHLPSLIAYSRLVSRSHRIFTF